jgi:Tol biopolymer transport system component
VVGDFKEGKDLDRSEIYFIGQNNENFKSMVVEGRDFRGTWSPDGSQMIYSVYNSKNGYLPELWISDASGDNVGNNRQNINLNTWADKCSFAGNGVVYCAVPQSLPEGAGLVPKAAADIADDIYEINLNTGARRMIATPSGSHNISQIITTPNANYLMFTDSKSKLIYRLDLQ